MIFRKKSRGLDYSEEKSYDGTMVDTRFSVSIQIMMTLATHKDEMVSSKLLAEVLSTNPTFIRKIVSGLVEAGLIKSFKGKGGGMTLGRDPKKINLKDIYLAATLEKPIMQIHQKPTHKTCTISQCVGPILQNLVCSIEKNTHQYLAKKTLQDLLAELPKK